MKRKPNLSCLDSMSLPLPRSGVHYGRGCPLGTRHTRHPHSHKRPSPILRATLEVMLDDPAEIEAAIEKCRREKVLLRRLGREEQ